MKIFRRMKEFFFPMSYEEKKVKTREFYKELMSDDLSDEQYRRIYGTGPEAEKEIARAKQSWHNAGLEVIKSTERMYRELDHERRRS